MRKILKAMWIVAVVAVLGFSITSCETGSSDNADVNNGSLLGTWLASEDIGGYTMTFRGSMTDGGEVEFGDHPYHGPHTAAWSVSGNELTIVGYSWTQYIGIYIFSVDGDTLIRQNLNPLDPDKLLVYTRQ